MHNISAQRRFRYFDMLDDLDVNDQLLFTSFVLEDIRCMIKGIMSYTVIFRK